MKSGKILKVILPNSCGSSWQKTAIEVLIPPVNPALKAAPEMRGEKKKSSDVYWPSVFPFLLMKGAISSTYLN